ncbi:MAG: hypothetical protein J6Q88_03245 [Bacteroidales bacterium]|jgi:hypothetical protein|nr:hypothetical protein [Bacteroidales bacterium]
MKKLFCIIFALVSVSLASAQEMSDSLYRAGEQMAYRKYAKSRTRLDSIANGMEYVNTYVIRSERRREVSDRIAYLMASTPEYLAGTSLEVLLSYVYNEDTREYVIRQKTKEEREVIHIEKIRSLGFNAGIGAAVETCEYINEDLADTEYIYGGHLLFSIGDNRNFFNFEIGARYRYWVFRMNHWIGDPNAKYDYDFHQLRLVLAPKFNLIRQKRSPFYLYVAPEFGYNYPIDMHATGYYEGENITLGARAGLGIGRFEVSASYTHDVTPMMKYVYTDAYRPQQVGVAMTIYFSNSGRK